MDQSNMNNYDLAPVVCAECGTVFGMPKNLYESAKCSEDISFFCPYGHRMFFPAEVRKQKINEPSLKDNVVKLNIVRNDVDDA